ncbi:MAG: hypothetical protein A2X36_11065 [Elusimicrobia bacterium GWA2_69_24]|nr:MAG: hypothetical protein A2X36_11065 [Elusimicrobia bacterium GWA2_69_24]HBL17361.1 type II toxin-antitoxin system HicB family antitoxin [Elusimicrobiota bacterium]
MTYRFTAVIERDRETGLYIGIVPGLPGAHTQAASLDELSKNLAEVVELCLEESSSGGIPECPDVVGTQLIEIER